MTGLQTIPKEPRRAIGRGTGRSVMNGGYVVRLSPRHPRASNSGFVMEHILVVEAAMGKLLRPSAEVHHVDRVRTNNASNNLVACDSRAYHFLLHVRQRAYDACGNADALRCECCAGYDRQGDMTVMRRKGTGYTRARHRACHKQRERARQGRAS